jgi:hypothetical protein
MLGATTGVAVRVGMLTEREKRGEEVSGASDSGLLNGHP